MLFVPEVVPELLLDSSMPRTLGPGNQQIRPAVIKKVGKNNIIIIAAGQKIRSLYGRPLLVDIGCESTNQLLCDYYKVISGYRESVVYKVTY